MKKTYLASFPALVIKPIIVLILMGGCFLLISIIRGDLPQGKKFLQGIPLFSSLMNERENVVGGARASELQLNHPSFQTLADFILHPEDVQKQQWQPYIDYFQKAAKAIPQMVNAYALLGYLYRQTGEDEKAMVAYQQAAVLYPRYFWFFYNLGVLYFQNGLYDEAARFLTHAVSLEPKDSVVFFNSCWFYQQIWQGMRRYQAYSVKESLKQGYYQGYLLLLESAYRLKDFSMMEEMSQKAIQVFGDNDGQLAYYVRIAALMKKEGQGAESTPIQSFDQDRFKIKVF